MRAYRLKQETVWEIERLAEEWECTHAEVIERAVVLLRTPRGRVLAETPDWYANPEAADQPFKGELLKPSAKKKGK